MDQSLKDALAGWRKKHQRLTHIDGSPDSSPRASKGTFRLPSGQRIRSNDPEREFHRNVKARWKMLEEEGRYDERELANTWGEDALNRRRGIQDIAGRAAALGMTVDDIQKFDVTVATLEAEGGIWEKARHFYDGLRRSGIFDRDVVTRYGVYLARHQRVVDWQSIQEELGLSYRTIHRRVKAGASLSEILKPVQCLEFEGRRYSAAAFARTFRVSKDRVRAGIEQGLTGTQILRSRRPRGRPRQGA